MNTLIARSNAEVLRQIKTRPWRYDDHFASAPRPCQKTSTASLISLEELRDLLITQQSLEDQTVWLTTSQVGFPVTADVTEFQNDTDRCLDKLVPRFLHPVISNFIQKRLKEFNSTGQTPSRMEKQAKRLEETWGRIHSDIQITGIASRG